MKKKSLLLLLVIVCIGIFFRFYNVNWDQNFHLHPDERFLTLVGMKEALPKNIFQYLNPATSTLNPTVLGFSFFVYGVLPITLNFLLTIIFHTQTYDLFTIQGRILSGVFDCLSILLVYCIADVIEKKLHLPKKTNLISAFFYAISVLPIQLSHFFTSDIFLSFFMILSFYFSLLFTYNKKAYLLILSAAAIGLAIACKINALAIVPLEVFLIILPFAKAKNIKDGISTFFIFIFCAYCTARIADPYLFATGNFLDPHPNLSFIESVKTLTYYANPDVWYPPSVQWIHTTPVIFSLFNTIVFGMGIGISLFCIFGVIILIKKKNFITTIILCWIFLFFLYQSIQFVKTMRYFIFLYPLFAVCAGVGFTAFIQNRSKIIILVSILFIVIWPLSFLSIYIAPHTRIAASSWIYANIPSNSTILGEYWDDPLPLQMSAYNRSYTVVLLHVFDIDTTEKWKIMNQDLAKGDYLVLSSNRGWGSIPRDTKRYPIMGKWYKDLFAGKLSYKKVAEFTSYPSLTYLGIPITIPDYFAEEAFTVYDHPQVTIFKKIK